MKTKLFIDFDGTLFDTRRLKTDLFNTFKSMGFAEDKIELTYKKACEDYIYSPIEQLQLLQDFKKCDAKEATEKFETLYKKVPDYLFKDSVDFLGSLDREKYEVSLLTLGDEDFQKKKVESSKIAKYFDNIYYCRNQKWIFLKELVDLDEKFFIIDDRGDAMYEISKEFKNSIPIEINRSKEALDIMEKPSSYDGLSIKNFVEATQYL
ncbi:MAG: HAD hydrolase-like protein [Patescibacteria group bacterium]